MNNFYLAGPQCGAWRRYLEKENEVRAPNILTPGVGCGGCGAIVEGTPENLPPGWKIRRHRGGHDYRCPNCQKKKKGKSV